MEESKVSGALFFILRISRFLGVSPVSFRYFNGGYNVAFTYKIAMIRNLIVTLIHVLGVIAFILSVKLYNRFEIGRLFNLTSSIIMSTILCYNTKARIFSIVINIGKLNKIKDSLIYLKDKSQSLDKKILVFCLGIWSLCVLLTAVNVRTFTLLAQNLPDYLYLLNTCQNVQYITYETQMTILNLKIYEVLKNLSQELRNHLRLIKSRLPTVVSTKICIRNIANSYITVCKVVDEMNELEGKIIFSSIATQIFYILFSTCCMIDLMFNWGMSWDVILIPVWIGICLFRLYLILEPCHYILCEAVKIKVLFSKIACYTVAVGQSWEWEWEPIFKQLDLAVPTFTPLGIITLDRSFLPTIISVITTYLVIVIPYVKSIYKNYTFY